MPFSLSVQHSQPSSSSPVSVDYVLTAYSLPHSMSYLPTQGGAFSATPCSVLDLMDAAVSLGLAGVEIPLTSRVPSFNGIIVETPPLPADLVGELKSRHLRLIADYGALLDFEVQHTKDYMDLAARSGTTIVRAILSHLLCGDRRKLAGGWEAHRNALAVRLKELLPFAEERGITLALENHQDADSDDFWWLYEQTGQSAAFGVTLDTGNPLAVGQDPVVAARQLAPLIRHVHLKDYTLHFAPNGYRLARCAAGDGVIDFPAILEILRANGHVLLPGIEIAAQQARTVPLLEADWWQEYPAREATTLIPVLQRLWTLGKPENVPYASAWERGESSEAVSQEEWKVLKRSVHYFQGLT